MDGHFDRIQNYDENNNNMYPLEQILLFDHIRHNDATEAKIEYEPLAI